MVVVIVNQDVLDEYEDCYVRDIYTKMINENKVTLKFL